MLGCRGWLRCLPRTAATARRRADASEQQRLLALGWEHLSCARRILFAVHVCAVQSASTALLDARESKRFVVSGNRIDLSLMPTPAAF
mmetsp:Transcript_14052/g.42003  ORF Transcript_14052/g.42003 Transcript_14052/m.42003 type:complete len:88 (-) Transcript_14052:44-307(-)